ncbi:MAG TPA: universal stress protein [Longimicrobium sp.]|nr:universal stress protein [Longimicrobium sp.]
MPDPIRTIVVGVAHPDAADPALRAAADLALASGAELHLVHALEAPLLGSRSAGLQPDYMHHRDGRDGRVRDALRAALKEAAAGRGEVRSRAWVYRITPGEAILTVARRVDAGVIVVGASRHGAVERALLGTAAQRVIRAAPVPVLVVRRDFGELPRRVLLTTDLSGLSATVHETGLDAVENLFPGRELEVRSLAVVFPGMLPPPLKDDALTHAAQAELAAFLAARRPRSTAVEPATRIGRAAEEIPAEAAEWDADLLVLGTHARHGMERILAGSVAESALAHADCNVLVVPPTVAHAAEHPDESSEPALTAAHA